MSYSIIPLTPDPDQNFTCTVPVDSKNITLLFRLRYNTVGGFWWMSVSNAVTGEMLIDSVPLVTGEYPAADLLGQYTYLEIGSAVVVKAGNLQTEIPDDTNLGTDFVLLWGDTVE